MRRAVRRAINTATVRSVESSLTKVHGCCPTTSFLPQQSYPTRFFPIKKETSIFANTTSGKTTAVCLHHHHGPFRSPKMFRFLGISFLSTHHNHNSRRLLTLGRRWGRLSPFSVWVNQSRLTTTKTQSTSSYYLYFKRTLLTSNRARQGLRNPLGLPQGVGPEWLIGGLLVLNGIVFFMWRTVDEPYMDRNFTISLQNLSEGRYWTLVTSVFSHAGFMHLLFNSIGLWVFGTPVASILGPTRFLIFFLSTGICGSLSHVVYTNYFLPYVAVQSPMEKIMNRYRMALGMSGAVNGTMLVFACLFPEARLLLWGVIPVRAASLAGLAVGYDLYQSIYSPYSGVSSASHLGGALYGAIYGLSLLRRFRRW
jgi:membrane associated rhomboid family serine protease